MRNFFAFSTLSILTLVIIIFLHPVTAPPLSTNSRWIVDDDNGQRVKLACVNWVSHLEVMVAEGLSKQPVDVISKLIVSLGFNCVRLTWPLFLVTDESLGSMTVRKSFQKLGLIESIAGLQVYNPSFIDLSLIQAYQAVVSSLRKNNVMVILDNHISKPGWCCGNSGGGGNGFFGDQYFDPELWIDGMTRMAKMFKGVSNVVGMSLRNELRGSRQNVKDWYRYMQGGAEAVHSANPDVLVILSGLSYDKDLSFIRKRPVSLTFTGKLVFEVHWYSFTDGKAWQNGNLNQVCGRVMNNMMWLSEFLLQQGWPLFVSEFGMDQRGINVDDNRYINCFLGVAAELDLDWALWTLVGSYYLREGVFGLDEVYGMLSWNWCETRNSNFLQRISALQTPFRGPVESKSELHKVIFHPLTGLCVRWNSFLESLKLGPCSESEPWTYSTQKTLSVKGTLSFLQADDSDKPAKMGLNSSSSSFKWDIISKSRMHLSSKVSHGATVCLDADSNNNILTSPCKCLSRDITCDPSSQWFKLVDRTRGSAQTKPIIRSEKISCWG